MSKTLFKYFPLFDHLYILQLFEYNFWDFFDWFIRHPFERSLQKKHTLSWTPKIILTCLISVAIIIFFMKILSDILFKGFFAFLIPIAWLILFQLTPLPILLATLITSPVDLYLKKKIIGKARAKLGRLNNLKVIAITGSYGKTSTKDILYTLLWKKFKVVKTPKSFNTPMGVAQTILEDVKENTDILIAEIGAYKRGDITNIAKLIKPQIGIITAVGPQHLGRFGSLENIAKAKFELAESLLKNGMAILNGNSPQLQTLASNLEGCSVNFYGRKQDDFYVADVKTGISGTTFTLHTPKGQAEIQIPLIGEHHAQNFLAAAVAAMKLGLSLKEIQQRANLLQPTPHRMEIKKIGIVTLIDNSYNTNPESAKASLELLNSFKGFKKIVITPGFIELGIEAPRENRGFGRQIGKIADTVIIVGNNAKDDLLKGLKDVNFSKENLRFSESSTDALVLVQQLGADKPLAALLENDLPDQYF